MVTLLRAKKEAHDKVAIVWYLELFCCVPGGGTRQNDHNFAICRSGGTQQSWKHFAACPPHGHTVKKMHREESMLTAIFVVCPTWLTIK